MTFYLNFNQQIPSWAAVYTRFTLFTNTDALSVVNTGRDRHCDLLAVCDVTASMAVRTFLFYDLTASVTVRTGLYISYRAKQGLLCIYDLTFTAAFRTSLRTGSWFCTCSMAGFTLILQIQIQLFFASEYCLFKGNPYRCPDIGTFHRSIVCTSAATASEKISENITKDISHIAAVEIKAAESSGTSAALFKRSMSELIILSAFFCIA